MITKQPEVILFNYTDMPKKSISLAVSAWTSDNFFESKSEITEELSSDLTDRAFKAFHRTALEYVDTIWVIKNCSRAFQQQLTRTRLATYAIQSLRVVTRKGFAENGCYNMPPSLTEDQKQFFHASMLSIQHNYEYLIELGVSPEDARGILPLNIHSDISFRINLSAMYHMLNQRLCVNTQWEYRQVATQMKEQIYNKMGFTFAEPISAPCVKINKCPMREEYCGVPVWKFDDDIKSEIYSKFVNWKKNGKEWDIKWLNDENPIGDNNGHI